ncbi:hypothetical protein GFH48_26670 [Streptomyces fagopyri]|uniref:Uncharacterized protein n=1 Tax=Streptomyces fagopyri TaxID=2662397 RepID=A0A5Q0LH64_9ACTN|nr:hypothetical protein [Streptomyces fagopyri]QFZ76373.1 hypothetical protein GFH48_26670 [Streptomyces fagopyri]
MMTSASASPTLFETPVAVLALAVSLLSLATALGALGWQIAKHRLDGGRPKVYLNTAVWEPGRRLTVNRSGKWELFDGGFGAPGAENIELAQLVVENPGRTAITVYSPGLAVAGTRSKNYRISPRSFELKDFGADSSTAATSVRINPYDRVTFLFDYWSAMSRLKKEANGQGVRLRGCVSVAGRGKSSLSSKRLAWLIQPEAWMARTGRAEISPFTVIWRELMRANVKKFSSGSGDEEGGGGYLLGIIVSQAMQEFPDRPSVRDFVDALRRADQQHGRENFQYASLILSMDEALDCYGGKLSAWTFTATKPV